IRATGINENAFKVGFKSNRTDYLTVKQLKDGEKPIIDNNKQNIYAALNNLSSQPDKDNIEFLIDIASNLSYGQGSSGSEFRRILDEDGITPSERENTNWSEILGDTIMRALNSSKEDVSSLYEQWNGIVEDNKKLTPEQQKLLDLRKSFTDMIINDSTLEDAQSIARTARVRKNLDYFIASSEIPSKQKEECLEKMTYLMSDDYKITPQLQDKKLQVVDEMLNDMLIKTPEDEILTIKDVDQRSSGMCAAISICRKMIAYEDKTRFVELIMDELEDSDEMPVFDVTELGTGKKVNIPKTKIDYNSALEKGYRIIDASAHNWMHNAHASGDGTIQTEHYIPFDEEHYGIYDDSSWYLGLDESQVPYKRYLQSLIKEQELLKSFNETKKEIAGANCNIKHIKKDAYETQKLSIGRLNTIFSDIFPEKSNTEISAIEKGVLAFYKGVNDDNEVNIAEKLPAELKSKILADYIIQNRQNITEEQKSKVQNSAELICSMTDEYTRADLKLNKLQKYNSLRNKYIYNKKLYNLAAAHRLAVEADVNMQDGIIRYERSSGLPPRNIQITDYMKKLETSFSSPAVRNKYADKNGRVPSQQELEDELNADLIRIETTIPSELNSIMLNLLGNSIAEYAASIYKNLALRIQNQEPDILDKTKQITGISGNKNKVIAELNKWSDKLSYSPSQRDISEAVRLLGYEDNIQFCGKLLAAYFNSLKEGISEEEYNSLAEKFGGKDKIVSGLEEQQYKYQKICNEYSSITKKWNIPSARTNILKKLEKEHFIISRSKLDILKNKFTTNSSALAKNEQIPNIKEREKENNKLYSFSGTETEIFKDIEKTLPSIKKYSKVSYQDMNEMLYDTLEEQYSNIGMLNGQFWVREEGSSGLAANEQIRIIEQMTGEPYHLETDITKAVNEIKKGTGSGIVSLSVDDKDYAFHAQYVPKVSSETFVNPLTDEKTMKDVLWMDNSWGKSEKEHFWNGKNGFSYTDYGRKFGWKDGFILNDNYMIGLPVEDIEGASGVAEEDNEEFGLYTDMVLPGTPVDAYQKLYKMFNYILTMDESEQLLSKLESQIAKGSRFSIKELEGLDDACQIRIQNLENRVKNEINSKEDFDKLPEDDELKFLFNKIAVYLSTDNPELAESVLTIDKSEDLKTVVDKIEEEHINQLGAIVGKSDAALENLYDFSSDEFGELFDNLEQEYKVKIPAKKRERILDDIFFDEKAIKKYNGSLKGLDKYLSEQVSKVGRKNILRLNVQNEFVKKGQDIIHKQIDENLKIKSLDSPVISNSPLGEEFIAAVDKYLNPKSDEEMLMLIQGLQEADYETADGFFDVLKPEDIGIDIKEPYYYVKLYKADNSRVERAFSDAVSTMDIYSSINISKDEEENTPEEIYRDLYVKLSDMDVQKYIKAFKAEAFQKYQLRQAFPEPVVISDDLIAEKVFEMLSLLEESSQEIQNYDLCI
ncbi:MAG: hypothetical protein LUH11_03065, partial [Candidatus Gastranaerophilales bacterium]|nr:hypothetical protein [Candidatus Gastranaerophilales bacterium]